ncbi:MAG: hypothetical protein H0U23_11060 [Blastocatellia bacterium]|nr:hypothetical protein [Blastocatellia bacterium]
MDSMLESFDRRFAEIHRRSLAVLGLIPQDDLFRKPRDIAHTMAMFSVGEYLLRSAAAVEQTCGGLTTRLWDDPFEWTLPEKLAMKDNVLAYFEEVEVTRASAFAFLRSDADLIKELPAPERLRTIFDLLLETVGRSEHYQGRAFAVFQMVSDAKLPRL